jgi:hypothetical protein
MHQDHWRLAGRAFPLHRAGKCVAILIGACNLHDRGFR